MRFIAFTSVVASLAGCGGDVCLGIAREYQAAMLDALICDPTAANACGAGRPLILSAQAPDGTVTLEGLCMPPCLGAVNPQRTTQLDDILAHFYAQGCKLQPCWCPPPSSMPATCTKSGACWGLAPG